MKNWEKFTRVMWRLMMGLLLIFCLLSLYFSFFRAHHSSITIDLYNPLILLTASIFYLAFLIATRKWLDTKTEKQLKFCSAILILVFFAGLLFVGLSTRLIPKVDLRNAYIESINMLETRTITDKWQFERFPHQKAVAFILYFIYRFTSAVGITNYRVVGIIFNAMMVTLTLIFLHKFVCAYQGRIAAIMTTIIFVCNPVMYFYVGYFYSDTFCLPFMMGGLWLAGQGLLEAEKKKKVCFLIMAAILLMLGVEVRATTIFAVVAIVLVVLSTTHRKQGLLICSALVIGLLIGKAIYWRINATYAGDLAENMGHPVTHYWMMGSNEATIGSWSNADDVLTSGLPNRKEKVAGNLAVIMDRVHSMGFEGCVRLIKNKIALVWGDGRIGYQAYNTQMEQYGFIYEYSMGDKAIFLRYIMQFMRCSLYILMLVALMALIHGDRDSFTDRISVVVCLSGFLFYVLWEVSPKYSLMFLPIMSVLAGTGVEILYGAKRFRKIFIVWEQGNQDKPSSIPLTKEKCSRMAFVMLCVCMLLTVAFWAAGYQKYVGDIQERSEMRVNQEASANTQTIDREGVLQSFVPKDAFNCVSIKFRNDGVKGNEYRFQILDHNMDAVIEQDFMSDTVADDRYKLFRFDTIYPSKDDVFYIKVFAAEDYDAPLQIASVYRKQSEAYASGYDFYPGGDLIRPGVPEHTDMIFRVTNIKLRPIVSQRVYIFLSFGSLLLEGIIILTLYTEPKKKTKGGGIPHGKCEA